MIQGITPSKYVLDMVHKKFKDTPLWNRIEIKIATLCSEIPFSDKDASVLIKKLKEIKEFLLQSGSNIDDLDFIDEEIISHSGTKQVSLYNEEDMVVDEETAQRFIKNSLYKEGVIATNKKLNWEQIHNLTNRIYTATNQVKFFITPDVSIQGQVVAEIYETPIEIAIVTVYKSKKVDKETGEPVAKKIALFGDAVDKSKWNVVKEINKYFYVTKFVSEENEEYMLLSENKTNIGEYMVKGVITKVLDHKKLTDSLKMPTKMRYIFAYSIQDRIVKFATKTEFSNRLDVLEVNRTSMFDFPFTKIRDGVSRLILQPLWFKWLVWGWLAHAKRGAPGFDGYPLHIMIIAEQNTGKSVLLETLFDRSKEKKIWSGSSSTLKGLIPSFKHMPVQVGHLAMSNRFAFVDEFLRCILTTQTGNTQNNREESVGLMNDLLEHKQRVAASGVGSVSINMTARILTAANPARGINSVTDLFTTLDKSFLSRWLVYWQDEDHIKMIKDFTGILPEYHYKIGTNDWVSILDYLHSFEAELDFDRINKIFQSVFVVLSKELTDLYRSRHIHHLICISDGIIKARCMMENDMSFKGTDEDYENIEIVWKKVIRSWIPTDLLRGVEPKDKLLYLPEAAQWLFHQISEKKRPLSNFDLGEIGTQELGKNRFIMMYQVLSDQGMVRLTKDGLTVPYWWDEESIDSSQNKKKLED